MDNHLAAISALRTIERAVVVPRDSDERRAVLGAFRALYRLLTPREHRVDSHAAETGNT